MRRGLIIATLFLAVAPLGAEDWPQWRGPSRNGVSTETNLPVTWSKTENVVWKLPLPAWSGSTPIVSSGRIFLNVADDLKSTEAVTLHLWCVDRDSGAIVWRRPLGG
ncbi:MAG TPA: hypothetical protein VEL79_20205, partial [Vicinamibacterales bacterium]|nr:hypothetical protein [Vicinamibacterales bacterium]